MSCFAKRSIKTPCRPLWETRRKNKRGRKGRHNLFLKIPERYLDIVQAIEPTGNIKMAMKQNR
jgi:hypothetical protein